MPRFKVFYRVGSSEREVVIEAASIDDAEIKANERGYRWVDIYAPLNNRQTIQ